MAAVGTFRLELMYGTLTGMKNAAIGRDGCCREVAVSRGLAVLMFLLHVSQVKKFDFVLVSVHLKAAGLGNSDVERLEVSQAHKLKYAWEVWHSVILNFLPHPEWAVHE